MKNSNMVIIIVILLTAAFLLYTRSGGDGKADIMKTYNGLSPQAKSLYFQQSERLTKPVDPRIVELDQLTIGCFGSQRIMQMAPSASNLGGQCCGALKSAEAYEAQLAALDRFVKENGDVAYIPRDPYDVPVEQAQQLTAWDSQIVLSQGQQHIYDEAIQMSHHGGPCCCRCWKWYAMSGLAKKLIVEHGWDEHQIAELWDISSSCGHDEGVDMHQHYATEAKEHASHTSSHAS